MKKKKVSFTEGALFFKITLFALPIMATGILQVFYNMADSMIVGRFSDDYNALAAVGSTSPLTNLIINLVMGVSVGASIVIAQLYGAQRHSELSDATHTAMTFSIISGVLVGALGFIITPYALGFMGIRDEIFAQSALYMRIIMCGLPASAVYNFGAAIIRSTGDSKTPFLILAASGALNVLLNLMFVVGFGMTVDGVALATIISQYASAVAIFAVLMLKKSESYAVSLSKLKMNPEFLKRMMLIGVPSGLQGSIFSIANVCVMSAVNTFPTAVISGYSIAENIEGFNYTAMNCFNQSCTTFTGQNYGARKSERIKRTLLFSIIQVAFIGILVGQTELLFGRELSRLYISADDPNKLEVIEATMQVMRVILPTHFLLGIMEVISGALVGLGRSFVPMVLSIVGVCGFRIFWIYAIFLPSEALSSVSALVACYPISWTITIFAHLTTLMIYWKKEGILRKTNKNDNLNLQFTQ